MTTGCAIITESKGSFDMKVYNYTVLFEPMENGGYDVKVPAIPEICTFGDTLEEARDMAEDAIRCYLESGIIA